MIGPEPAVPPALVADVQRVLRDHGLQPRRPDLIWAMSWLLAGIPPEHVEPPESRRDARLLGAAMRTARLAPACRIRRSHCKRWCVAVERRFINFIGLPGAPTREDPRAERLAVGRLDSRRCGVTARAQ
jgi:hypothetical protein